MKSSKNVEITSLDEEYRCFNLYQTKSLKNWFNIPTIIFTTSVVPLQYVKIIKILDFAKNQYLL